MSKLTYTEKNNELYTNTTYYKTTFNNIILGSLIMTEDGFYKWFPTDFNGSCIEEWVLLDIANKLKELNKDINKNIKDYFQNKEK